MLFVTNAQSTTECGMPDDTGESGSIYAKEGPLTPCGLEQAKKIGAMIDDLTQRTGLKLELAVTSPLVRSTHHSLTRPSLPLID